MHAPFLKAELYERNYEYYYKQNYTPGSCGAEPEVEKGIPINSVDYYICRIARAALGKQPNLAEGLESINYIYYNLEKKAWGKC